jgi:hypothetical protein
MSPNPLLRIEGSASIIVEHLWLEGDIEYAGTGAVAFRHCDFNNLDGSGGGFHGSGAGKTFIEDVIGSVTIEQGHRLLLAVESAGQDGDVLLGAHQAEWRRHLPQPLGHNITRTFYEMAIPPAAGGRARP